MTDTTIAFVHGRRVWDSRGRPTVEAEVLLEGGGVGRAIAPAGASTGTGEALDLRDGGDAFGGYDVTRAVAHVNGEIFRAAIGLDATDQAALDRRLIDAGRHAEQVAARRQCRGCRVDGGRARCCGCRRPAAVSLSGRPRCAHAAAAADPDFWRRRACRAACRHSGFPRCLSWRDQLRPGAGLDRRGVPRRRRADEGGRNAAGRRRRRRLVAGVLHQRRSAGNAGARDRARRLHAPAARSPSRSTSPRPSSAAAADTSWRWRTRELDSDGMVKLLSGWIRRYPIVSVEDPLAEDDDVGFAAFTHEVGKRVQVIGDDFLVSKASRVREAALRGAANAVLLKPNQRGTLTETLEAWEAAQAGRLRRHRLRPLRRDRGRDDRASRGRLGRRPAQGRQLRAQRAHGEVERGAAHRGGSWCPRPLRRSGVLGRSK